MFAAITMITKRQHIVTAFWLSVFGLQILLPAALWVSSGIVKQHQKILVATGLADIDTLIFSAKDFEELQFLDEKEFVLNGTMYDIHKVVHHKDSDIIVVTALRDTEETHLVQLQTAQVSKQKNDAPDQENTSKPTFLHWVWWCQPTDSLLLVAQLDILRTDNFEPTLPLFSKQYPPPNPPPDFV